VSEFSAGALTEVGPEDLTICPDQSLLTCIRLLEVFLYNEVTLVVQVIDGSIKTFCVTTWNPLNATPAAAGHRLDHHGSVQFQHELLCAVPTARDQRCGTWNIGERRQPGL
jgi:hypothetical protein